MSQSHPKSIRAKTMSQQDNESAWTWFEETLHDHMRETLRISRLLVRENTPHHEILIFENERLGRVLTLDGAVQTTQGDEYIYHEMLAHVPLFAHGQAEDVLIIGGGDGGCLREVLKHPVKRVTLVDIDETVIKLCKHYMPSLSQGAFEDPRAHIVIADGCCFLENHADRFDLIIVDSTDPIGPGAALFETRFLTACRDSLKAGGILVTQNGTPFLQADSLVSCHRIRKRLFADSRIYLAPVPSYHGGFMAFGWGCDDPARSRVTESIIAPRIRDHTALRYYNAAIHGACFVLPNDLLALIASA